MTDRTYPMLVSLLPHTQRLLRDHATLLERSARQNGLSSSELAEHEQMLTDVRAVVEAQHRWLRGAPSFPRRSHDRRCRGGRTRGRGASVSQLPLLRTTN